MTDHVWHVINEMIDDANRYWEDEGVWQLAKIRDTISSGFMITSSFEWEGLVQPVHDVFVMTPRVVTLTLDVSTFENSNAKVKYKFECDQRDFSGEEIAKFFDALTN